MRHICNTANIAPKFSTCVHDDIEGSNSGVVENYSALGFSRQNFNEEIAKLSEKILERFHNCGKSNTELLVQISQKIFEPLEKMGVILPPLDFNDAQLTSATSDCFGVHNSRYVRYGNAYFLICCSYVSF